jgi:MFS family permease
LRRQPRSDAPGPRPDALSFWAVTALYIVVLCGITLPSPLYVIYQERWDLGDGMITLLFATYPLTVLGVLPVAGRLSDAVGRRPVLLGAVVAGAASSVIFLVASPWPILFAARAFSGVSSALVVSTANAAMIELVRPARRRWASLMSTITNQAGLGLGALVAGVLADLLPSPTHLVFWVHLVGLAIVATLLTTVPETVSAIGRTRSRQRLKLPDEGREQFVAAAVAAFAAFALCGLLAALAPAFVREEFGGTGYTVGGAVVFLIFAVSAASQPAWFRLSDRTATLVGLALFVGGTALLTTGLFTGSIAIFLVGVVASGAGVGAVFMGTLALVNHQARPQERGHVAATYFTCAFSGLVLPVLAAGWAADHVGLPAAAAMFTGLVSTLAVISAILIGLAPPHVRAARAE